MAEQGTPARAAIFFDRLAAACHKHDSLLCVGLDPPLEGIPDARLVSYNRRIIDATADLACCFKPNIAYYEARGIPGMKALAQTVNLVRARGLPVILDAKRGDISSVAAAYAKAAFERWNADAVTLSPFLGRDSVEPFTAYADRGVFLLCHTSNPSAREVQELETEGMPLYQLIAALASSWNRSGNVGLVVGATYPEEIARVRRAVSDLWFLLPGIGAQGGDLAACLEAGLRPDGLGVVVNVSRAIYQAADPRAAALDYRDRINETRRARRSAGAATGSAAAPGPASAPAADQSLVDSIAVGLHALGAVRFGEFTLKSGQKSPLYLDLRLLVSDPALMRTVARAIAGLLSGLSYERIAAIPYGGLPIGQAVALETGRPLLYPRGEVKEYGTKKAIEGAFTPGETVVVLDDLVTTGGSKLEAIAPLAEAGLVVKDIVVLVDREQGGAEELAAHGYALHAVLTLGRLLDALVRRGAIDAETAAGVRSALGIA
ncbi:MAG: orotidine-5'-phosphate decarboxylase [Spirochaetes bacterium]|nr:orotidine-5'-phosphate decarboxylase [Spirochaetota bacterium]